MDPTNGEWIKLFSTLDMGVMIAIGIIALICERASKINDALALLIPLALGTAWGMIEASRLGWGEPYVIAKGALMNGAGASVAAQLVSQGWDKFIEKVSGSKTTPLPPPPSA